MYAGWAGKRFHFFAKKEEMLLVPAADLASAFCLAELVAAPELNFGCFDFGAKSSE
jgi:hypothetical protein